MWYMMKESWNWISKFDVGGERERERERSFGIWLCEIEWLILTISWLGREL